MRTHLRSFIATALVVAPLAAGTAQRTAEKTSESKWSDQISAGHWVRASNINGKLVVVPGTGDRVEVTAVKRWRRGDPATVRVETRKVGDDIQVCALYDDQKSCDDRYEGRDRRGSWRDDDDDRDVSVDFTITLPRGVRISGTTVNGSVDIAGATSDVKATSVNGSVTVEANGGPVEATTVNGSVMARLTAAAASTAMSFTTVNGRVVAELPPNIGADVYMTTVNGSLNSDFDFTIRGRIDPRNLSVHVGPPGGPRITLTTVNGDVELRKR